MDSAVDRIVVALDAASENRTAIGTAARLAARWGVHLHGVFVEDDDLIRLANLPFARVVSIGVGVETFDLQQARWQMRVYAERARQDLAASARRHGIEWSFEIAHGGGLTATTGDFLVAGTTTRPIGNHFRIECRWWTAEERGPATRLLAHRDGDPHGAVAALLRGQEPSSERLLAAAIRLSEANEAGLTVICPAALAEAPGFKSWLDGQLKGHTVAVELELLPAQQSGLHRRITELHCRLVAIEAGADEARPDRLRDMVASIACDVLVVR